MAVTTTGTWGQVTAWGVAMIDVDQDGIIDIVGGSEDGTLLYFRRSASGSLVLEDPVVLSDSGEEIDVGSQSWPTPFDLDGDGDLDLLVANSRGKIHRILCTTPGSPSGYQDDGELAVAEQDPLDLTWVIGGGTLCPTLATIDADGDGLDDVVAGDHAGVVWLLHNTGSASAPSFSLETFSVDTTAATNLELLGTSQVRLYFAVPVDSGETTLSFHEVPTSQGPISGSLVVGGGSCPPASVPGSLSAGSSVVTSGTGYTLSWGYSYGADSYELQEATSDSFSDASSFTTTGTSYSISHQVSTTTTFYYRVRALSGCSSPSDWSESESVVVTSTPIYDHRYLVAGIAHLLGAEGTDWRSSLAVCNRSSGAANISRTYRHGDGSVSASVRLAAGAIVEWQDAAVSLFGVSGNSSGAVDLRSDVEVTVSARTFNFTDDGTYGQLLPGVELTETLTSNESGLLTQIKGNDDFRTNIGFVNFSITNCTVRIRLYRSTGAQIGTFVDAVVPPGDWKQVNDVFAKAGAGNCDIGYATVEVRTSTGNVWAYASVVDNRSGDPTTVGMVIE
jgi:hypothetical protein